MKEIVYDNQFNANEWFVIFSLCVGILLVVFLPQRFTKKTVSLYYMCGVFFGFFFDHTLSVLPVSFYDLNDTSRFELIDFLSHFMYGSYSYLFFYLYDYFNTKLQYSLVYILAWAFMSVGWEQLAVVFGLFHYQHGYNVFYSFVIYLSVQSIWVSFYYVIRKYGNKRFSTYKET